MIIDFHTHIVPPAIKEDRNQYTATDPAFRVLYASPRAKLATSEDLIASMDKDGVDISVALNFAWTNHDLCVATNDYIMEAIARYPKRIVGFGSVSAASRQQKDAACREVERCAQGGMRGIGEIRPDVTWLDPESRIATDLIEVIARHNLILLTHASEPVGHEYPGKGDITPEKLYPLVTRFPSLTLVCAHWGGGLPFYALMPEVKKALANVYFDTAASPFLYNPQIYSQVIQTLGAERILFGSDYPLLTQSRLLKEIRSLNLPQSTEQLILGGNAQRLMGLTGKGGQG